MNDHMFLRFAKYHIQFASAAQEAKGIKVFKLSGFFAVQQMGQPEIMVHSNYNGYLK